MVCLLLQALTVLVELACLICCVSALSPAGGARTSTTDRRAYSQLVKDLQTCATPHDVIQRVGRHVNSRVDPNGVLACLVLVRLSKQCISYDNQHSQLNHEPSSSLWENEAMKKTLAAVVCSLVESDLNSDNSAACETLVEGTKCASVLSRLLPADCSESLKEPLHDFWSKMAGRLVPRLDAQHLSGLHWAMEGLYLSDPPCCRRRLPSEIQAAYTDLDLPFSITPGRLNKDLMPDLSVEQLISQVDFRVDNICTNSNQVVKERRQTAWQGDDGVAPFAYAGKKMPTGEWSPVVRAVRDLLEESMGQYYNGCLLNLYPDGDSGMRYHVDPDQGTLWDRDTAVVSVGATRRFCLREMVESRTNTFNFVLMHGDVTHMFADCQQRFQHTIKKANDKSEKAARASLVFKRTWNDDRGG